MDDSYTAVQKLVEVSEYKDYIKENEGVIIGLKEQLLRIMNAFIKAGTNIERDIFPKL